LTRVGVVFPQHEIGDDVVAIRDYAQTAESLGFSHLLAFDHVLGAEPRKRDFPMVGPYSHRHAFHEPMCLFSFLSGLTSTLAMATGVLVLPQRQTVLLAKQAAELDLVSDGRFRLGVGVGWNKVEYQGLGVPFADRGRRLDEQVALLRELWTHDVLDTAGDFHVIDGAGLLPRPKRLVPIWFGGFSRPAYERAARTGDGFLFSRRGGRRDGEGPTEPVELSIDAAARLRDRVAELGRDVTAFGIEGRMNYTDGPAAWNADLAAFAAAGFDTVAINVLDGGLAAAGHIAALSEVAAAISLDGR
jgi:probable F420-dependent oxidoreductase